jgi:hypothetical protein
MGEAAGGLAAGRPRGTSFALITGDAGIGKSRLAEELLSWAQPQGLAAAKTRSYAARRSNGSTSFPASSPARACSSSGPCAPAFW